MKQHGKRYYIKKLDDIFSKYIRLKYSKEGICECYTCGKYNKWQNMQCGHFFSRKYYATRWDENNVRVQCVSCNVFHEGEKIIFTQKLFKEIGAEKMQLLGIKKNNIVNLGIFELKTLITLYENKRHKIESGQSEDNKR